MDVVAGIDRYHVFSHQMVCRSALRLSKHYVSVRYYAQHVVLLVTDGQYANVLAFHDEDDPFEGVLRGYIAYGR